MKLVLFPPERIVHLDDVSDIRDPHRSYRISHSDHLHDHILPLLDGMSSSIPTPLLLLDKGLPGLRLAENLPKLARFDVLCVQS